jgi:quercetin dioxygenase-like cupin family protein
MLRKLALASAALALTLSGSSLAAQGGYVPTRTVLQETDVPNSNYRVVLVVTEIAANQTAARHTHPGGEVAYMLQVHAARRR